jgi:hypothetical protein
MSADFNIRSDSVNVEQIMEQIRARIREKRGVDYTEQQIRELAAVKLEKFLDPRGVRSDLLEQFRKAQPAYTPPELPNYSFEDQTLYESTRPPLRWVRKLLNPILKLFFNPNPLIQALNIQSRLNTMYGEREARREATRRAFDQLQYELMHNLVIETTRMSIEVKNLKMRVESLAGRLEFNERRARALESVVVYKPTAEDQVETSARAGTQMPRESRPSPSRFEQAPQAGSPPYRDGQQRGDQGRGQTSPAGARGGQPPAPEGSAGPAPPQAHVEGPGQRSRRRRRRRGRRGGGSAAAAMAGQPAPAAPPSESTPAVPHEAQAGRDTASESPATAQSADQGGVRPPNQGAVSDGADPGTAPTDGTGRDPNP